MTPLIGVYVELIDPGTPGVPFLWQCPECPVCGRQHRHGAGLIREKVNELLGLRVPHCARATGDIQFYLTTDRSLNGLSMEAERGRD